ncbi:MAG: hypothetical protein ACXWBR_08840 [Usitatibacter sp.]
MNARTVRMYRALALAAGAFSLAAFAQEPGRSVAQLRDLAGNALVSRESGLAAGSEGLRLSPGTRVITTKGSRVVVAYDDGCEVKLKENERFEVEVGKACEVLAAMPQSILSTPTGAAVATGAGAAAGYAAALPLLGGAAGVAAVRSLRESRPASPS